MENQTAGTQEQAHIMSISFARAMKLFDLRHGEIEHDFRELDSQDRLEVTRWTLAIIKTPMGIRECGNCLRVRANYSHSHRIRYYDCEVCGTRYYAEVIPPELEGPRSVILTQGFCSEACQEEGGQHETLNS